MIPFNCSVLVQHVNKSVMSAKNIINESTVTKNEWNVTYSTSIVKIASNPNCYTVRKY